ncbi:Conserved hypothetical protein [gamma proteobacterium HdN1]|nr:Conserved hypothetical protein [gamma proteobacterium HdN1]
MNTEHAGSCLCGEVRYTVSGSFDRFFLCHCSHCRKDTGSAHAANLFASSAKLSWRSGESLVKVFQLPGTRHARSFCMICGSALPFSIGDMTVVPAGSLDTGISNIPDGNIFTGSRATWDHDLHEAKNYDSFPA